MLNTRQPNQLITITVSPHRRRWNAHVDGRLLLTESRMPFLDAARLLLALGYDPETRIVMQHQGSDTECLRATIRVAAAFVVDEERPRLKRAPCGDRPPPMRAPARPHTKGHPPEFRQAGAATSSAVLAGSLAIGNR